MWYNCICKQRVVCLQYRFKLNFILRGDWFTMTTFDRAFKVVVLSALTIILIAVFTKSEVAIMASCMVFVPVMILNAFKMLLTSFEGD